MSPAASIAFLFSVVSLCAAAFNAWIWWLRRSQRAHLWLALAAIGVGLSSALASILYDTDDVATAALLQRSMLACGAFVIFGFTRFAGELLEERRACRERTADVLAGLGIVLALVPGAVFPEVQSLVSETVGSSTPRATATPVGVLYLVCALGLFSDVALLFFRRLERLGDDRNLMLGVVVLLFTTGANDIAVGVGLYPGPLLMPIGYAGFVAGFTFILTRRMTHSMNVVEQSAGQLQVLVERRTEELRQLEMQLAHGEKMATIGTLAAGVAHEINTPIAFVTSNFNQLEALRGSRKSDPEVHEILAECSDGVDRIKSIVSDLLDLARKDDTESQAVDLRDVVASALPIVGAEARSRARLVEQHDEGVPSVLADPHQLGQVVVNLVMNALQAIEPGQPNENRVTIRTRYFEGFVQLIVHDTGPGIPDDVRAHVFDPFFTTKAGEGTGLGLAVTQQLIAQHRGQITLESAPNGGTEAIVSLPPLSAS